MPISLPSLSMRQPNEIDGYMIVINDLLPAIETLSKFEKLPSRGCALLAAHALECALKAIIRHHSLIFTQKERHDLVALWKIVASENIIDISNEPPDWVKILSIGHGPNFYFRYQQGENKVFVHGGQTPALAPMFQDLTDLTKKISSKLIEKTK